MPRGLRISRENIDMLIVGRADHPSWRVLCLHLPCDQVLAGPERFRAPGYVAKLFLPSAE